MHTHTPDTFHPMPCSDPGELSDTDFADYLDAVVAAGPPN